MKPRTVRAVLKDLDELEGKSLRVVGWLCFERERYAIEPARHLSWRLGKGELWLEWIGLWLYWPYDLASPLTQELKRLHGKRVVISGRVAKPKPGRPGCGHLLGFPAALEVESVRKADPLSNRAAHNFRM